MEKLTTFALACLIGFALYFTFAAHAHAFAPSDLTYTKSNQIFVDETTQPIDFNHSRKYPPLIDRSTIKLVYPCMQRPTSIDCGIYKYIRPAALRYRIEEMERPLIVVRN